MRLPGMVLVIVSTLLTGTSFGAGEQSDPIEVTYISVEAIYVNAGRRMGLLVGDTLVVASGERKGSSLVVVNVSSHSAACRRLDTSGKIAVGDILRPVRPRMAKPPTTSPVPYETSRRAGVSDPQRVTNASRLRGYVSIGFHGQRDRTGAGSSWYQPSVGARLTLERIGGTSWMARLRHRSRWSYRDRPDDPEATHRLTELGLLYRNPGSAFELGLGRVLSPYISGIGYLDGGYLAVRSGRHHRLGVVLGTEPDRETSALSSETKRAGLFVAQEIGSYQRHRLLTTLALSGSYAGTVVSREFVYLQNTYTFARRLTAFQSVEMDINRQWRKQEEGDRVSFTNLYVTTTWNATSYAAIDASFDTRRNIRDYRTIDTPDSLFDSALDRGFDVGLSLRSAERFRFRARAGIRFGEDTDDENQFATLHGQIRNIVRRGHYLTLRVSRSKTRLTVAYRPLFVYQLPVGRKTRVDLSGGAYLYDTFGIEDKNYYAGVGVERSLFGRYWIAGRWREFTGGSLESTEVFLELNASL